MEFIKSNTQEDINPLEINGLSMKLTRPTKKESWFCSLTNFLYIRPF